MQKSFVRYNISKTISKNRCENAKTLSFNGGYAAKLCFNNANFVQKKSRIFREPRIKIRQGGTKDRKNPRGKKVCCRVAGAENCCKRWHASPHNLLYTHKHGSSDPTHTIFVDFFFGGRTDGRLRITIKISSIILTNRGYETRCSVLVNDPRAYVCNGVLQISGYS